MKKNIIRVVTVVFFILVGYYLYQTLGEIDYKKVRKGLSQVSSSVILASILLTILNYFILTSYDYLGFRELKSKIMTYGRTLISSFVCYSFTLNLSALIGGMGFRFRIYSGWKVDKKRIPYIIFFSTVSNWSGYILLLGVLSLYHWGIGASVFIPQWGLFSMGIGSLLLIGLYLILTFKRYSFTFRDFTYTLPSLKTGFLQLFLSVIQWNTLALMIYFFLREVGVNLPYFYVLYIFLFASIAGVVIHIPAGIGLLEAVFLKLSPKEEASSILVALICFRAVYYFLPLFLALPSYFMLEIYQKKKLIGLQQTDPVH